jgi:hypothetical protein
MNLPIHSGRPRRVKSAVDRRGGFSGWSCAQCTAQRSPVRWSLSARPAASGCLCQRPWTTSCYLEAPSRSPTTPGGGIGPVMGCRWIFARIHGPIAAGVVGNATDGVELL